MIKKLYLYILLYIVSIIGGGFVFCNAYSNMFNRNLNYSAIPEVKISMINRSYKALCAKDQAEISILGSIENSKFKIPFTISRQKNFGSAIISENIWTPKELEGQINKNPEITYWLNDNILYSIDQIGYTKELIDFFIFSHILKAYLPLLLFLISFAVLWHCKLKKELGKSLRFIICILTFGCPLILIIFGITFYGSDPLKSSFSYFKAREIIKHFQNNPIKNVTSTESPPYNQEYQVINIARYKYLLYSDKDIEIESINPIADFKQISSRFWILSYSEWSKIYLFSWIIWMLTFSLALFLWLRYICQIGSLIFPLE